jgi:His-Xaa-Ser system protein HxsD
MEQPGMVIKLSPVLFRVELAAALYEREAVFAAAERLTDEYYIKIEPHGEGTFAVLFQCKDESGCHDIEKAATEFINAILEEQVRLDLMKRTGPLREIIYRHAFLPIEEQGKRS